MKQILSPKARERKRLYMKEYHKVHRDKYLSYKKEWDSNLRGWEKTFYSILSRCTGKSHKYFKKGIRCLITKGELKKMWFRDKAYLMEKPSADRLDPSKDYSFDNCQYLEHKVNSVIKGVHCAA